MLVPPKALIEGKAKILCREGIRNGLAGDVEGLGGNGAGSCKEDNLCLCRIKGEAQVEPHVTRRLRAC